MNNIKFNSSLMPTGNSQLNVKPSQGTGFGELLDKTIEGVQKPMAEASTLTEGLLNGQHSNIHETMIAMEKSSLSFRMLTKVQTKVLDAYKEIMRMQL